MMLGKRMRRLLTGILTVLIITSIVLTAFAASNPGDINGDGKVTAFDAQMLAEANAGLRKLTDEQQARAKNLNVRKIINHVLGIEAIEPEEPTEEDAGICETAHEFAANMRMGWNLGLSLSVSSEVAPSSYTGLISMISSDGKYNRSETLQFDPKTGSVTVSWQLGQDNGVIDAAKDVYMSRIDVEQWNFSLGQEDTLTFRVDEFYYTTSNGKLIVPKDKLKTYTTDMSGGTGYATIVSSSATDKILISDILSIHCKMSIVSLNEGSATLGEIRQYELAWGNPVTTQEMINVVRDRGFNLIRIQVSYFNHMDSKGNVDELWLNRVQEVVDYCMNAGIYCLLTTTGDRWLTAHPDDWRTNKKIYAHLWEQIAERFVDYDDKLLFESCNEILYENVWWNPPSEAYDVMNDIYQTFVDTVRASGGYNATRNLVLNTYSAAYDYTMNKNFHLPQDSTTDHLIAQVHVYVPHNFTFNETNLGSTNFMNEWGSASDRAQLDSTLRDVKKRFIDELGVPVLIGEFGTANRTSEDERAEYISYYVKCAEKYGIELCLFDDGHDFAVFDRRTLTWTEEKVLRALFQEEMPEPDQDPAEIDAMTQGWMTMVVFSSGTQGTFNRSDTFTFPSGSKTVDIVWKLGKDGGVVDGNPTDSIGALGIEFWNWSTGSSDYLTYTLDKLVYVTAAGEMVAEGVTGEYITDMGGSTGYNQVMDLSNTGLKIQDVLEIRATVTFVEKTSQ